MIRTVVYAKPGASTQSSGEAAPTPPPLVGVGVGRGPIGEQFAEGFAPRQAAGAAPAASLPGGSAPTGPVAAPATNEDSYVAKLVKYVPVEVVAFFAPLAAIAGGRRGLLIAAALLGLLATPAYLWNSIRDKPAAEQPLPHFYILATIAFVAWALGTSQDLDAVFRLDAVIVAFTLAVTVLVLPLVDAMLARFGV